MLRRIETKQKKNRATKGIQKQVTDGDGETVLVKNVSKGGEMESTNETTVV